jgi:S1-C subfamily serine protease
MWASTEDSGKTLSCANCSGSIVVPEMREPQAPSPAAVASGMPANVAGPPSSPAAAASGRINQDENRVSPMAAAMLVLQERARVKGTESHGSPRAAFLWGMLAATGFLVVAVLVGYMIYVSTASQERPLAEIAPSKPSDKSEAYATPGKASNEDRNKAADGLHSSKPEKPSGESARKDAAPPKSNWYVPKEIVARCGPSVALITGISTSGSGFLVGPNVLATNAHVLKLEFMEDLHVFFPSASGAACGPVTPDAILYEDETRDLALISVRSALPPLALAHDEDFAPGEEVIVIGSPGLGGGRPIPNAINQGILSTKLTDRGQTVYQLGASVNPGNSGGPVFNSTGKVVGVATARGKGVEALAFSIPAGDVQKAVDVVSEQDQNKTQQATARHRAAVAFRKLDAVCSHYGAALDQCVEGMIAAVKKKRPLEDGIRAARTLGMIKINDNVVSLGQVIAMDNQRFMPGVESAVSRVSSDPLVDPLVKDDLMKLLATCKEMKDHLEKPRGTLMTFQNKRTELIDEHKRLSQLLRGLLSASLP